MKTYLGCVLSLFAALLVVSGTAGCKGPEEAVEEDASEETRPVRAGQAHRVGLDLAPTVDEIKSIQLYAQREEQLPILSLGGGDQLTLEFDLIASAGRPLSVYFYHANREWERDLFASRYLSSFHRDDLFDYTPSHGTQVEYVHYTYAFPTESIDFRISGNYILRVTEQGREDEVLFERAFFVTEEATSLDFGVEHVMTGGSPPLIQPVVTFTPPRPLAGNVFDYNVCFVQNGRLEEARCSNSPSMMRQPDLLFYLQPEMGFRPAVADYVLDLSTLSVGGDIELIDRSQTPPLVVLQPDYARFPASSVEPILNGQPLISEAVRDVADPDIAGEYVQVRFSFVPPNEQRLPSDVLIAGSFNGWMFDMANQLTWVPERGRYEGDLVIKQGVYEYRYSSPDGRLQQMLQHNLPRSESLYSAFVYYADASLSTDRLLAAQVIRVR